MLHTSVIATIEDGQTTSDAIDLAGFDVVGFITDAAFDGSAITFSASVDGETFTAINTLTVTIGDSEAVAVTPPYLGFRYIKLISGAAQDGADTFVTVALRSN